MSQILSLINNFQLYTHNWKALLFLLILIFLLGVIIYIYYINCYNFNKTYFFPYSWKKPLNNILKIILIDINVKIILFFVSIFNLNYLTPLLISIIYCINMNIYCNIHNINHPIKIVINKVIVVFIISSLIYIIKCYVNLLHISLEEVSFILDILLCFLLAEDSIGFNYSNFGNCTNDYNLFSNNNDNNKFNANNCSENTTPVHERTSQNSNYDSDTTPTRGRSPNNTGSSPRSISPKSIWNFIDSSYSETTNSIKRFFGNTFYIWDKADEPQKVSRFSGAIAEVNNDNNNEFDDSYKDANGNTWKNPNGTIYTNQDELRSVINIKKLATTPSEKHNLEKAINSTGGPIMFTQDTEGNFIFYRLGK